MIFLLLNTFDGPIYGQIYFSHTKVKFWCNRVIAVISYKFFVLLFSVFVLYPFNFNPIQSNSKGGGIRPPPQGFFHHNSRTIKNSNLKLHDFS